jgi:hypothetical protein
MRSGRGALTTTMLPRHVHRADGAGALAGAGPQGQAAVWAGQARRRPGGAARRPTAPSMQRGAAAVVTGGAGAWTAAARWPRRRQRGRGWAAGCGGGQAQPRAHRRALLRLPRRMCAAALCVRPPLHAGPRRAGPPPRAACMPSWPHAGLLGRAPRRVGPAPGAERARGAVAGRGARAGRAVGARPRQLERTETSPPGPPWLMMRNMYVSGRGL